MIRSMGFTHIARDVLVQVCLPRRAFPHLPLLSSRRAAESTTEFERHGRGAQGGGSSACGAAGRARAHANTALPAGALCARRCKTPTARWIGPSTCCSRSRRPRTRPRRPRLPSPRLRTMGRRTLAHCTRAGAGEAVMMLPEQEPVEQVGRGEGKANEQAALPRRRRRTKSWPRCWACCSVTPPALPPTAGCCPPRRFIHRRTRSQRQSPCRRRSLLPLGTHLPPTARGVIWGVGWAWRRRMGSRQCGEATVAGGVGGGVTN